MSPAEVLLTPVFTDHGYTPYGELTLADVEARAAELSAVARTELLGRVAPVARAWRELARALVAADATTVAELDPDLAHDLARRTWVLPNLL